MTIPGAVPAPDADLRRVTDAVRQLFQNGASQAALDALGGGGGAAIPQGRLTLSTGIPVMTSTVAATGTLLYAQHLGNQIGVYDGSAWVNLSFAETSLALSGGTASRPHDIWGYSNAGTFALDLTAWTSATARATALARQDGVLVKDGDATRRYLGTIYLDGSKQCEWTLGGASSGGTPGALHVWNMYNRAKACALVQDSTVGWTYNGGATIRQANASTGNQISVVRGRDDDVVDVQYSVLVIPQGTNFGLCGIGLDSTTTFSGVPGEIGGSTSIIGSISATYKSHTSAGLHTFSANERTAGVGNVDFYGSNAGNQNGLYYLGWH